MRAKEARGKTQVSGGRRRLDDSGHAAKTALALARSHAVAPLMPPSSMLSQRTSSSNKPTRLPPSSNREERLETALRAEERSADRFLGSRRGGG